MIMQIILLLTFISYISTGALVNRYLDGTLLGQSYVTLLYYFENTVRLNISYSLDTGGNRASVYVLNGLFEDDNSVSYGSLSRTNIINPSLPFTSEIISGGVSVVLYNPNLFTIIRIKGNMFITAENYNYTSLINDYNNLYNQCQLTYYIGGPILFALFMTLFVIFIIKLILCLVNRCKNNNYKKVNIEMT